MRIDIRQNSISPRQAMAFLGAAALVAAGALAAVFGAELTAGMCLVCAAIAAFLGLTEDRFDEFDVERRPSPPPTFGLRWTSFPARRPGACSRWPRRT